MKTFLFSLFAVFLSFGFATHDAEAKRMGGGKSFGMQRSAPAKQDVAPQRQQQSAAPAQAAPQKRSWMGPIAGLAAGLGLAALFSHLGLGEEMANFLMLALLAVVAFIAIRWLLRKNAPQTPAMQYAGHTPSQNPMRFDSAPAATGHADQPAGAQTYAPSLPPGFDAAAFAREAKLNFIRLQAAFDAGNQDDLRAFTTPEIFAELAMQIAERGAANEATDVLAVNANVIEAVEDDNQLVVSVRFTGQVREGDGAPAAFDEIWHLTKPANGTGGWLIAGIQQN
ncbi:MAG: transporter [Hydrogenophilales bacterium 16-64-46]|nr:MAG: transporter [Hydrogenophilales bacterium 12-64-13]OYZ06915.1 MAG: transporter [Hydrogenophilales bacterium 16-64-46]OZA39575.1 MAG: transporter [Hydrogenophilales bacterium 17-64-34]